ncbi:transposase DNA-binding-containing protein [Massilia sp. DJPM01]|nr:transposase DNA-binding-containing protein [Massilia sp. DJPM01]
MEAIAAKPAASIPEACDSWSETCAAYRVLSNAEVTWEGILAPHWARMRLCCAFRTRRISISTTSRSLDGAVELCSATWC